MSVDRDVVLEPLLQRLLTCFVALLVACSG